MEESLEIFPALGIARLGRSDEFFLGPEPGLKRPASYRDANGELLPQATRFRIFRCVRDASGVLQSAEELTAANAQIEWTVHVTNRKGAADGFPTVDTPVPGLRNPAVANRAQLIIDPGPRILSGPNQTAEFDTGTFLGRAVNLGSARTDTEGRLLVIGAKGESGSVTPNGVPEQIVHFANNNTWFDNTCDGIVSARVTIAGQPPVPALSAWVVSAPPDFAPEIVNFRTLYDVMLEIAVQLGQRTVPATPSFVRDILPILLRGVGYQWVNGGVLSNGTNIPRGAFRGHSVGASGDFASNLAGLADPTLPSGNRKTVLDRLRNPAAAPDVNPTRRMPRLHDETDSPQVLPPTPTQYAILEKWVEGTFVNDLPPEGAEPPQSPELLPDMLNRAALEACSGGAFYPGIEVNGEIVTKSAHYAGPFRLKASPLVPGLLTAQNAVPWQADFLACRWGGTLGWWPAQRPDHVIPEAALEDPATFDPGQREMWERGAEQIDGMMASWHALGIVARRPHPTDPTASVFVETERTLP